MKTDATPREPLEVWALLAYVVGAGFCLAFFYLGLRSGGALPRFVWGQGIVYLQLTALALLVAGAIWSYRRRPFLRRRRRIPFLRIIVVVGSASVSVPYPSSHEGHESAVCFRLPVEGEWTVFWGGETVEQSLLAGYTADRRWGIDLVVARDGKTHAGTGTAATDFFAFGKDVFAPADGVVVRAVGDLPDGEPGRMDRRVDATGNQIVLGVGEREFVVLAHLAQGSLAVREGERVKAGDRLARVGCSGWSRFTPEPHLAVHLQDTPEPGRGEAIPWHFCGYVADGARVERGLPRGGVGPGGELRGQRVAREGR
jgi:hypothetical protein